MRVYEGSPSGLRPGELRAVARADPGAARSFAAALLGGLTALIAAPFAPVGPAWVVGGLALMGWGVDRVRRAARRTVERPALVGDGRPVWEGVRRSLFTLHADDPDRVALRLAAALDAACGDALVSIGGREPEPGSGTDRLVDPDDGTIAAWGVGRPPAIRARGDTCGIWMRRTPSRDGVGDPHVVVLADPGRADAVLRRVVGELEGDR